MEAEYNIKVRAHTRDLLRRYSEGENSYKGMAFLSASLMTFLSAVNQLFIIFEEIVINKKISFAYFLNLTICF